MKLVPYACPHVRIKLKKDPKDTRVSGQANTFFHGLISLQSLLCQLIFDFPAGNGLGIRVVGGKEIPGRQRECGAYIAKVFPGGVAEQTGKVVEGIRKC